MGIWQPCHLLASSVEVCDAHCFVATVHLPGQRVCLMMRDNVYVMCLAMESLHLKCFCLGVGVKATDPRWCSA